jgi:hypothetical protein
LKGLTGNVKWEIFGIDDTLNKVQKLWNKIITVIHDENSSNVKFDRVLLFFILEKIEWRSFWDEKKGSEFELTFDGEMFYGQMVFPIVGEGFVEFGIFFVSDIVWVSGPDWFDLNFYIKTKTR